jgi:hypothetical protein
MIFRFPFSVKNCSAPPDVCNGKFDCSNQNAFHSVCFQICNTGYSTNNTRNIKCNGDKWIGPTPVCEGKNYKQIKLLLSSNQTVALAI